VRESTKDSDLCCPFHTVAQEQVADAPHRIDVGLDARFRAA
jgi:hypothetical protein